MLADFLCKLNCSWDYWLLIILFIGFQLFYITLRFLNISIELSGDIK